MCELQLSRFTCCIISRVQWRTISFHLFSKGYQCDSEAFTRAECGPLIRHKWSVDARRIGVSCPVGVVIKIARLVWCVWHATCSVHCQPKHAVVIVSMTADHNIGCLAKSRGLCCGITVLSTTTSRWRKSNTSGRREERRKYIVNSVCWWVNETGSRSLCCNVKSSASVGLRRFRLGLILLNLMASA